VRHFPRKATAKHVTCLTFNGYFILRVSAIEYSSLGTEIDGQLGAKPWNLHPNISEALYRPDYFDQISGVDSPPLARQIESCLLDFGKEMNLTWTPCGDGFIPDF
jgi:hypothetical protein